MNVGIAVRLGLPSSFLFFLSSPVLCSLTSASRDSEMQLAVFTGSFSPGGHDQKTAAPVSSGLLVIVNLLRFTVLTIGSQGRLM